MSNIPNFHPIKKLLRSNAVASSKDFISAKLDNVFLQANGMSGYQYIIKKKDKQWPVTLHWQWDHKKNEYYQCIDGYLPEVLRTDLVKQHEQYNFGINQSKMIS